MESILGPEVCSDSSSYELASYISLTPLPEIDALRLVVNDADNLGGVKTFLGQLNLFESAIFRNFVPCDHGQSLRSRLSPCLVSAFYRPCLVVETGLCAFQHVQLPNYPNLPYIIVVCVL